MKTAKKQATVFLVPSDETASGKHEVAWAPDGDLNKAHLEGRVKKFSKWKEAEKFAATKGRELKAETIIHDYGYAPTLIRDFSKPSPQITAIVKGEKYYVTSTPLSKKEALSSQKTDKTLGIKTTVVIRVDKDKYVTAYPLTETGTIKITPKRISLSKLLKKPSLSAPKLSLGGGSRKVSKNLREEKPRKGIIYTKNRRGKTLYSRRPFKNRAYR